MGLTCVMIDFTCLTSVHAAHTLSGCLNHADLAVIFQLDGIDFYEPRQCELYVAPVKYYDLDIGEKGATFITL